MAEDKVFVEKCCSRCERLTWDNESGTYNELDCPVDGKPCDNEGRQYHTDGEGSLTVYDKDGNDITTILNNAEDQRLDGDI